jgi:ribosomal protein S1
MLPVHQRQKFQAKLIDYDLEVGKIFASIKQCLNTICRRFDPGGSLDRRVNLSLRVLAQMGWREMEHKGENAARVIPRQGGVLVVGVTSVRKRERV